MAAAAAPEPRFASLYVGDLGPDVVEAHLFEVFSAVGTVASIKVCRDSVTRKSLGYAYVNFPNLQDAERALDTLNYSTIKGRSCRIMWSHRDPSARKAGIANIFVKSLDKKIDNKALYDTFSLFGNILSCKVATDEKGESRGYGFVHFETEEAAQTAISRVNNMKIGDSVVSVTMYMKNTAEGAGKGTNLYVKMFPSDYTEEQLLKLFTPLGEVTSSVLMTDKFGRPFAFVNYETAEAATAAIEKLDGYEFEGVPAEKDEKDEKAADAEGEEKKDDADGDKKPEFMKLYVGRAKSKQERQQEVQKDDRREQGVTLYIKNLADDMTEEKLKGLFDPFGNVSSARLPRDNDGKNKGFGFVSFTTAEEATKAVSEMHLKVVEEKPLYVGLAERRAERQGRLEQRYRGQALNGHMASQGLLGPDKKGGKGKGFGKGGYGMGGGMGGWPNGSGMGMGMPGGMGMRPMNPMMMNPMMMGKGAPGMGMMGGGMMGKGGPGGPGPGMGPPGPRPGGPPGAGLSGISPSYLAAAPPGMQKQMLGERIYSSVLKMAPDMAGKITGMMLEMDNAELLLLLENPEQLHSKVSEARAVLAKSGR